MDVDAFVGVQKAHQLHKKTRHSIQGHIVAYCKDCLWFADLLDMSNYSRQNKGCHWILLCVDTFTRMAFAEPLKQKNKFTVKEGFESMMGRLVNVSAQRRIQLLITDSGSEFLNQPVQNLLRELKIVEVGDHFALGIIDRLSRTMKEMIFQDCTEKRQRRLVQPTSAVHRRVQFESPSFNWQPQSRGCCRWQP
jgi:transposase InsO family protein